MDKEKIKFAMVGYCERCGRRYTRKPPVDATICGCTNPDPQVVSLYPTLVLPRIITAEFSKLSKLSGVAIEALVNVALEEAARKKLAELKVKGERVNMPEVVVTTRSNV
jgi:hypothetical protein